MISGIGAAALQGACCPGDRQAQATAGAGAVNGGDQRRLQPQVLKVIRAAGPAQRTAGISAVSGTTTGIARHTL